MELVRDFSYFKTSTYSDKEAMDIASNALGYFRENGSSHPEYPLPLLFQAAGFIERLIVMNAQAERENPPRKLTDEELHTPAFTQALNSATSEFELALAHCLPVMSSVPSSCVNEALIASCFLNPLNSGRRTDYESISTAFDSRANVSRHALTLSLCYSKVPWTKEMYDGLVEWFAPSLLLCTIDNIPPMASPAVRVALDWAMSLDEKPVRRFESMMHQFEHMVTPSPQAAVTIELPPDFTV